MQAMGVVKVESFAAWEEVRLRLFREYSLLLKEEPWSRLSLN